MKLNFFSSFCFKNLKYKFVHNFYFVIPRLFEYIIFYVNTIDYFTFSFYIKNFYLYNILFFFKFYSLLQIKILNDISAVDLFFKKVKFKLIYNLRSIKYNILILINVFLNSIDTVPSICHLFSSSNWVEREIYDMFGLQFLNHPDLRRILTDYGFQGYPLRKDFPLMGFVEIFYSFKNREIVYKPVIKSMQSLRFLNFYSNWENLY